MSEAEYKLTEKDRAQYVRLRRRADNMNAEANLYLSRKAEELGVPFNAPIYNQETGEFKDQPKPTPPAPIPVAKAKRA